MRLGGFFSKKYRAATRLAKEIKILRKSPLLDPAWYRQSYPDLRDTPTDAARHYLEHGAGEGRNPHPLFDTKFYLEKNPDVAASGMNPLVHYILCGAKERRDPHPLFDVKAYLSNAQHLTSSEINPLAHYLTVGWKEGARPNKIFDPLWYLDANPDVKDAGWEPFSHYLKWGWQENHRRPAPWFDPSAYRRHFCLSEETNPLLDYVLRGEPSVFADLTGSTQSVALPGSVDFKSPVEPTLLRSAPVHEAAPARPIRIPDDFDSRSSPDPIDHYPYTIAPLVNSTDQNLRGLASARSDSISSSRMGYVDYCKAGEIVGWAYDIFMPKGVTVNIFIDNLHVDSQLCNKLRGDVMLAGHELGSVGFSYAIPDIFFDGEPHTICVKFLDGEPLPFVANGSSNFTLLLKSKVQFDGWIDRVEGDVIFGWLARRTQSGRLHAGGKSQFIATKSWLARLKPTIIVRTWRLL